MIASRFSYQSSRAIAALRLVLSLVFLAALYADPEQPARAPAVGYVLLLVYALFAIAMMRVAWLSWWWDHRCAIWAYLVDTAIFLLSIWFTEGPQREFSSPFMAYFVFLMTSSILRWNWRVTALCVIAISASYLAMGALFHYIGLDFEAQSFMRRVIYMIVIGMTFIFFGLRSVSERNLGQASLQGQKDVLEAALRYAAGHLSAEKAAILWEEEEEPPVLASLENRAFRRQMGQMLSVPEDRTAVIFDLQRERILQQ